MKTNSPDHITPLPWHFASDECQTVILAPDDLGGCTIAVMGDKSLDPDCDRDVDERDAAYLCHAANTLPELVAAVAAYIAWLDEPALDERENREGILRHALAAAQAVAL